MDSTSKTGPAVAAGVRTPVDERVAVREAEERAACALVGCTVDFLRLADGRVFDERFRLVDLLTRIIDRLSPAVVFTHSAHDSQEDHRTVALSTQLASERAANRVGPLSFRSPSSTAEFAPTVHIDISDTIETKVALVEAHSSQVEACRNVDVERIRAEATFHGYRWFRDSVETFESSGLLLGAWPPSSALVVAAHPDDWEIGAGGTIALLRAGGTHVHVVNVTSGEQGVAAPSPHRVR